MNRNNPDWLKLRKTIIARIEKLRDDIEVVGVNPDPLRGEISALRWLIKEVEPDEPIAPDTSADYHSDNQ